MSGGTHIWNHHTHEWVLPGSQAAMALASAGEELHYATPTPPDAEMEPGRSYPIGSARIWFGNLRCNVCGYVRATSADVDAGRYYLTAHLSSVTYRKGDPTPEVCEHCRAWQRKVTMIGFTSDRVPSE